MGCVCAAGRTAGTAFEALLAGSRRIGSPSVLQSGGREPLPLPVFTVPEDIFPEGRHHSALDTLVLARTAAAEALHQAGLSDPAARNGLRIGVIIGSTAGTALHFLDGYAAKKGGFPGTCRDIRELLPSNPAPALAAELRATGPALTLSNACTSGADAVGLGADCIRQGVCDVVLCGGADALSLVPHTGFARLTVASETACRPFDSGRDGLNLGEGAGMLILESADRVGERPVLGTIAGYGCMADAHHFTAPHPEARGLRAAMIRALDEAGLRPEDMAFVNVHGTATRENDRVEGGMVRDALPSVPVWASKGGTGHTLGAAGAIEAVLTLLALRAGTIPPSTGFHVPDPDIGVEPVRTVTRIEKTSALSLSLGFGGSNAALVLSTHGA